MGNAPVAYYRLDDGTRTMADATNNHLNGTYGTSVTLHAGGLIANDSDYSVSFSGSTATSSTVAVVPRNAILQPQYVSVEEWIDETSAPSGYVDVVSYGSQTGQGYSLQVTPANNAAFWVETTGGSGNVYVSGSIPLATSTTYHLVGTYDGTTARVYVDGVLDASATGGTGGINYAGIGNYGLSIGGGQNTSRSTLAGRVDEVAVYSSALSATQIASHYAAGANTQNVPTHVQNWLYVHQANGNRLFDHSDGFYNGEAGEPFYIGDPDVQAAFTATIEQNSYATDVFEDDAGGSYNCVYDSNAFCSTGASYGPAHYAPPECDYTGGYWCYKYGETGYEYDQASNPQQAYANDAIALANASTHNVIGNNGLATDSYSLQWLAAGRVEGAMAEGAWTQTSNTPMWIERADTILTYHSLHKLVVELSWDTSRLFFEIASHWIVYDPNYSIEALAAPNAATQTAGTNDTTYPEEMIVPTQPRVATPGTNDVTVFQVSSGVFVREYATCYQGGVAIGYCAAVVNTNGSTESITGLTQHYGHVLTHNTTATWAAGGTPVWSASVPSTIPANTGVILAQ